MLSSYIIFSIKLGKIIFRFFEFSVYNLLEIHTLGYITGEVGAGVLFASKNVYIQ